MIHQGLGTWTRPEQGLVTESVSQSWRLAPSLIPPAVALAAVVWGQHARPLGGWEQAGGFLLGTAAPISSLSFYVRTYCGGCGPGQPGLWLRCLPVLASACG